MSHRKRAKTVFNDKEIPLSQSVVSGSECTGLTARMPFDDMETDAYTDLYNIPLVTNNTDDIPKP